MPRLPHWSTVMLLMACGGASPTPPAVSSTPEPDPPAEEEVVAEEPAPPPDPPAEGTQLAAGRLGSVLDGLREGPWGGVAGQVRGPDVRSSHVLTRASDEGSYVLHLLAWESFRAVPAEGELAQAAVARAGEGAIAVPSVEELGVAATVPDPSHGSYFGQEEPLMDRGTTILARLTVAVRGGTFVQLTLGCEGDGCRAEDAEALAREVAASLRRGPTLRGGGAWELRVPAGAGKDRVLTIALPEDVVGLPQRRGWEGSLAARAMHLATGRQVMSIRIAELGHGHPPVLEPGGGSVPDPVPTGVRFDCAPFTCDASFTRDEDVRVRVAAAFAAAQVSEVDAVETTIPLADGRLAIRLPGPGLSGSGSSNYEGIQTAVRYEGARVRLRAYDTLRPGAEALENPRYFGRRLEGATVSELDSRDPSLSITRIVPPAGGQGEVGASLLVSEREGTGLIVELICGYREEQCKERASALAAALAAKLRRGTPVATADSLDVSLAGRRIEVDLPEGYVTTRWYGEHHGGWGVKAHHTTGAAATLELEDSGAAQGASIENTGRRTGRRTTMRLGEERFVMRERVRSYDGARVWGADLGCGSSACVILIMTSDLEERDRLLAALASAEVSGVGRAPCTEGVVRDEGDDTLNLREGPSTHAPVVRALDNGTEVTIERTRGRWARLAAPHEGWVWNESIVRTCE